MIAALLFRGGLVLRGLGVAVARRDGTPASRGRVLWRGLVAWSLVLLSPLLFALLMPLTGAVWGGTVLALLIIAPAIWSLALPERGLQDRLAGTCLVPR